MYFRSPIPDHNFSVSYEAETETISNPILSKQLLTSSNDVPSSPTYGQSSSRETPPMKPQSHDEESREVPRDEPARPLFGVEALMDSIKQAIQKRHDVLEDSDEMSSRRSSFSSDSQPNSPVTLHIPKQSQVPPPKPSVPQKPSIPKKPAILPKSESRDRKTPPTTHKAPPTTHKAPQPPKASPVPRTEGNVNGKAKPESDRSELLKSIVQGSKLRKTVTNDRSAPRV